MLMITKRSLRLMQSKDGVATQIKAKIFKELWWILGPLSDFVIFSISLSSSLFCLSSSIFSNYLLINIQLKSEDLYDTFQKCIIVEIPKIWSSQEQKESS